MITKHVEICLHDSLIIVDMICFFHENLKQVNIVISFFSQARDSSANGIEASK